MTNQITSLSQTVLNWEADKRPLYFPDLEGNMIRAEDKNAVVRSDWGNVLGIVSDDYNVFQNSDLFDKVRPLAEEGVVNVANAGFLQSGKLVYIQAQMAQEYSVVREAYQAYITLTNNHAGRARAGIGVSMVRVVCENTFAMANGDLTRFAHIGNDTQEFLNSSLIVDYVNGQVKRYGEQIEKLESTPFTAGKFHQFLKETYQKEEVADVTYRTKLEDLFYNGTETEGQTAYDAFNAVTEFNSNFAKVAGGNRVEYATFGAGRKVNNRAMAVALSMAGA